MDHNEGERLKACAKKLRAGFLFFTASIRDTVREWSQRVPVGLVAPAWGDKWGDKPVSGVAEM